MWPEFQSQCCPHVQVEFVGGSRPGSGDFSRSTLVPGPPPPSLRYQHDLERTNEFFRSPISVSCLKKLNYITTTATCRTNYKLKTPTNNLQPAKWPSRVALPLQRPIDQFLSEFLEEQNGVQIKVDPFRYHILPYVIKNFSQSRRYYSDHIFTNLQSTKIASVRPSSFGLKIGGGRPPGPLLWIRR